MIEWLKSTFSRFRESWRSFKREWRFNSQDRADNKVRGNPFWIMGFGRLRDPSYHTDDTFDMKPPYYGRPLMRIDGRVFVLKHTHYNPTTNVVRYLDTDKPADGFVVLTPDWLEVLE